MLKIYLSSVIIWFIMFTAESELFKEEFRKSRDKIKKETGDNRKIKGTFKCILSNVLISCIPFIRLVFFITKLFMTFNPDKAIELVNKKYGEKDEKDN